MEESTGTCDHKRVTYIRSDDSWDDEIHCYSYISTYTIIHTIKYPHSVSICFDDLPRLSGHPHPDFTDPLTVYWLVDRDAPIDCENPQFFLGMQYNRGTTH